MTVSEQYAPPPPEADWTRLRPDLVRYLARRLGDFGQAEDLVQDLWVKLAQRPRGSQPPRNLRAFAFHAAAGLLANHGQKQAVRARHRAEALDILWRVTDEITPEDVLLGEQALARLDDAIQALPERTRQVLLWRRQDGLTQRQVADRLRISQTAVEKHMRKAVAALAQAAACDDDPKSRAVRQTASRRS